MKSTLSTKRSFVCLRFVTCEQSLDFHTGRAPSNQRVWFVVSQSKKKRSVGKKKLKGGMRAAVEPLKDAIAQDAGFSLFLTLGVDVTDACRRYVDHCYGDAVDPNVSSYELLLRPVVESAVRRYVTFYRHSSDYLETLRPERRYEATLDAPDWIDAYYSLGTEAATPYAIAPAHVPRTSTSATDLHAVDVETYARSSATTRSIEPKSAVLTPRATSTVGEAV